MSNKHIHDEKFAIHSDADPVIVYHAECNDGFGAAWAAHERFGNDGDYIAAPADCDIPAEKIPEFQDHEIIFLDVCPDEKSLNKIMEVAASTTGIDHHESNEERIKRCDRSVYDENHSGAILAHKEFVGGTPPSLLKYVEDRDLWRFDLDKSRNVNRGIMAEPKTFDRWSELAYMGVSFIDYMADIGEHVTSYEQQLINDVMKNAEETQFAGYDAIIVNCPVLRSEIGERIYQETSADIAVIWRYIDGDIVVSLRTNRDDINLAEEAAKYGGGGHAPAAGFSVEPATFFHMMDLD